MRVRSVALIVALSLLLAVNLLGCAGTGKVCGDSCPVNTSFPMSFTAPGATEPMLRFMVPAGTENFFASPFHYVGSEVLINTPIGMVALYEFQKAVDVGGSPGTEAWTLIIKTTIHETGKKINDVLALVHTVKVGDKMAHRFWITGTSLVREVDELEVKTLLQDLAVELSGSEV